MLNAMQTFITFINGYLWGPPMIILLFGTHLFMTVRTRLYPEENLHGHQAVRYERS